MADGNEPSLLNPGDFVVMLVIAPNATFVLYGPASVIRDGQWDVVLRPSMMLALVVLYAVLLVTLREVRRRLRERRVAARERA